MPADAMVSTDIGNICSVANSYLRFDRAQSMFAAMSFGNCGYAWPTADRRQGGRARAAGHGLCRRRGLGHEPAGDADLPSARTSRSRPWSSTTRQWGAEKKNQIDFFAERYLGANLPNPSFAAIAKAMGARGIEVDASDEVGDALQAP